VDKSTLQQNVKDAEAALVAANAALDDFDSAPEQNVFASLEAAGVLEDRLRDRAFQDCEGAGNCGDDTYTQEFIVDGVHYIGTLTVEYNRHDKTYYFIEHAEFSIAQK